MLVSVGFYDYLFLGSSFLFFFFLHSLVYIRVYRYEVDLISKSF